MKANIVIVSALCLCFYTSKAQLNYTAVTNGLSTVSFEGGNTEMEIGDVDNDGDLDIISIGDHGSPNVNATEGGIMVWKNNGTGTAWSLLQNGNFGYGGCALGDVNNDGKMDIGYSMHHNYSATTFGDQIMEVALGNGSGSNWTPYDNGLATNGETYGMFGTDLADVNSDGLLDFGANSFGCCNGMRIYKNNGTGAWSQNWGVSGGNSGGLFKFGDFNNDGNVDFATSNEWGVIWKNTGAGQFTQSQMQTGFLPSSSGQYCDLIRYDIADVNNDGAKDVAIINILDSLVQVFTFSNSQNKWLNISNGLPVNHAYGSEVWNVALADMDMDGKCDMVLFQSDSILIYKGDGAGNWSKAGKINVAEAWYTAVNLGDFDHDGYTDIVYLGSPSIGGNNSFRVYLHNVASHALSIVPNFPQGNECFQPNSVQFIKWTSSVPSGPATITIEFSSTGNAGPWTALATNAPNSGIFQWTTPAVSSTNCFLRYTIKSGSSTQTVLLSAAFGIGSCTTPPTGVVYIPEAEDISIFPNPTGGEFTVVSPGSSVDAILVYNTVGQLVVRQSANGQRETVDMKNNSNGIYYCEVKVRGETLRKKIIISK